MKVIISLSAAPLTKGQYVIVKYGKDDWFAGTVTTVSKNGGYTVTFNEGTVVKFPDSRKLKPISKKGKKGQYSDEEVKALLAKPITTTDTVLVKSPATTKSGLEKRLAKMGKTDLSLIKKLKSMPYLLTVTESTSKSTPRAGFFPFSAEVKTVTFLNGTKVSKTEFFDIMRKVGGGLNGKPGKPFNCTKGHAVSRVTGKPIFGSSCEVLIDRFVVPQGWKEHYTELYTIPLNLFSTLIYSDDKKEKVYATYIAKSPVRLPKIKSSTTLPSKTHQIKIDIPNKAG